MSFLLLALQLLPSIIGAVQKNHGSLPGTTKKEKVLDTIGSIASAVGTTLTPANRAELSTHIDSTVEVMKAGGAIVKQ